VSKVLELESPEPGRYIVGFPTSAGFGVGSYLPRQLLKLCPSFHLIDGV
jgi:hypothetical protein